MASQDLQQVQAGGLITADFMNSLITSINDLEARVGELEAGGTTSGSAPIVTSSSPTGTVPVGGLLVLNGLNFTPLDQTTVNIGGATVTQFTVGSDQQTLRFTVPQISPLPATVSITVTTPAGTSSPPLQIQVTAATQVITGDVFVDNENTTAVTPQPGTSLQYQFGIRSETTQPVTYNIKTSYSQVNPASLGAEWQDATTLNATQTTISPGSTFSLVVGVLVPSDAAAGDTADLSVTATSVDGTITATSSPVPITIGQQAPVSDPRVQPVLASPQPPGDPNGNPTVVTLTTDAASGGQVILVPAQTAGYIYVNVTFADQNIGASATFFFNSYLEDPLADSPWHVVSSSNSPNSLVRTLPGGFTNVYYYIENHALKGDATTHDTYMEAQVVREQGSTVEYVSFARFLLRNSG